MLLLITSSTVFLAAAQRSCSLTAAVLVVVLLQVAADLLATVQRLYVDTLQKLDGALTAICREFDTTRYTKVRGRVLLDSLSNKQGL